MNVPGRQADAFCKAPPPQIRAVLLYGPDEGLASERVRRLVSSVLDDPKDPFRLAQLSGGDLKADPARLADEAAAISMLGGRRVVRVTGADNTLAKLFEGFVADPPGDALVVVEAGDLGKGALTKAFEEADEAAAIACYPDTPEELEAVIRAALKERGLSISPGAMEDLRARLGDDRRMTLMEIDKLALFKGPDGARSGQVTEADVDAIIGTEAEADFSEIADAAAGGDIAAMDDAFARALRGGESVQGLVRTVLVHFQRLHLACGLTAGGMPPEKALDRAFPRLLWKRKPAVARQLRLWDEASAMRAVLALGQAEIDTRDSLIPAEAAAGRVLLSLAAEARRARRG
jgi:DNA polymerase III subunit delta